MSLLHWFYFMGLAMIPSIALAHYTIRYFYSNAQCAKSPPWPRPLLLGLCHGTSFLFLLIMPMYFPAARFTLLPVCLLAWLWISWQFLPQPLKSSYYYYMIYNISIFLLQQLTLACGQLNNKMSLSTFYIIRTLLCFFCYTGSCIALARLIFYRPLQFRKESRAFMLITLVIMACLILASVLGRLAFSFFSPDISGALLVVICLSLGLRCLHNRKKGILTQEKNRLEQLRKNYQYYYAAMMRHEKKVYALHHDLANHLHTLQIMEKQGHCVKEYATFLLAEYGDYTYPDRSKNDIIDIVLCEKEDIIEKNKITLIFNGNFAQLQGYTNTHLAALYDGLLDYIDLSMPKAPFNPVELISCHKENTLHISIKMQAEHSALCPENPDADWKLSLIQHLVWQDHGTIVKETHGTEQRLMLQIPQKEILFD